MSVGPPADAAAALRRWGADPASWQPLAGDASTRSYARVRRGASTAVLMTCGEPIPERGAAGVEPFPFLRWQAFYAGLGLRVPAVLEVDRALGLVLLEDLGDELLQSRVERDGAQACADAYRAAIGIVRRLADEGTRRFVPDAAGSDDPLVPARLAVEMDLFLAHAAGAHAGTRVVVEPPAPDRPALARAAAALDRAGGSGALGRARALLHALCEDVHAAAGGTSAMVLCHRDHHARNLLLVAPDDEVAIIDFQDTRRGPRAYDVASLAFDPYVTLPAALESELIQLARPRGVAADAWRVEVATCAAQRLVKAAGSYAWLTRERGRAEYARWLPVALSRARAQLDVAAWGGREELWRLLGEVGARENGV